MEAYLDNSATTRCCEEAAQLVVKLLTEDYGNPSSLHNKGVIAENYMNDARKKIAKTLKVQEKEICFTSGGTESNNLAIIGVAEANKRSGKHVITTSIEHPSVSATMAYLEEHGYEVTYLPVDAYGVISLDDLKAAIRPDTILVSLIMAHNEIGSINDVEAIGEFLASQGILFHVDAVQALGKIPLDLGRLPVDLASFSAHKIGGPKGVGLLYIKNGTRISPLLCGGGQENGLRSGTQNVAGALAFATACEVACGGSASFETDMLRVRELRDYIYERLCLYPQVHAAVTCAKGSANYLPNIASVCIEGVESETLILQLDLQGFSVSGGSACSTHSLKPSRTLLELGIASDLAQGLLRISLGTHTSRDDVEQFLSAFENVLSSLSVQ